MPKYRAWGIVTGSKFLGEFEADSKEQAEEKAFQEAYCSLCHQCSRECDDPEIHEVKVEEI